MTVDVKRVYEEVASDEGKILHAYLCSENHKTIGIGHKLLPSDPEIDLPVHGAYDEAPKEECISEGRCYELFQQDVQIAIDGCRQIYDNWEELPQEVQHILTNKCYQLGQGGLSKFKNFKIAIEDYQFKRASEEMLDSRWSQQTPERAQRLSERMAALED